MRKIWTKDYTLRSNDFDKYGRIQPAAVLDLFQDSAGLHGEELGVGFDSMIARSYLWVLIRVKYEILSAPKQHSTVTVKTWPLEPKRLSYRREYCIEDQNGEKLIIGSSEWVVMHSTERKLLSVPTLYSIEGGFHSEESFGGKLSKVPDFESGEMSHTVNAGFCELDRNNHVNNTKYANFVLDAISPKENEVIKAIQLDYRKEVTEGTVLNIHHKKEGEIVLAKGENKDGDVMFASKIELAREI